MTDQTPVQRGFSLAIIARKVRQRGVLWGLKRALFRTFLLVILPFRLVLRFLSPVLVRPQTLNERLHRGVDARLTFWNCLGWELYPKLARLAALCTGRLWKRDPDFATRGFKQGVLPATLVKMLQEAIAGLPEKPVAQEGYYSGYLHHNRLREEDDLEGQVNRAHTFVDIESCPEEILSAVVRILQRPVAQCLGTNWRIVNVKSWKTAPGAAAVAMNAWHTDGMPLAALKVMVYLTGASKSMGTTELAMPDGSTVVVEGPPGTWLFFRNSEIRHRGIAPTRGSRTLLELTIAPSILQHYRPRFGGMNAMYPLYPWSKPKARVVSKHQREAARAA